MSADSDSDGCDWTQLPEGCRLLIVQHLGSDARGAWRAVCRQALQDVHAATRKLTWRGDVQTVGKSRKPPSATLPTVLFTRLPNLQHLWCKSMKPLTSIQGIPATLRSLDLIGCDKLTSLAPLQHCTALESFALDVDENCLRRLAATLPLAMTAMAPHLRRLELRSELDPEEPDDHLVETAVLSLKPLTRLQELSFCLQFDLDFHWRLLAECVGQMTGLQALDLSHNHGGEAVSALAPAIRQLKQLQRLELSMNDMDGRTTAALAQALASLPPTLTSLELMEAVEEPVNAAALAHAFRAHSATLTTLELSYTPLGPGGMAVVAQGLRGCSALTDLDLSVCHIGDKGGAALATALSGCAPSLTTLYLSYNGLGEGAASALAPVLGRMTKLIDLDYCRNNLGPAAAAVLFPVLASIGTSLTDLNLSENPLTDKGAAALAPALKCMTALVHLELSQTDLGPVGAAALASALPAMTRLEELMLDNNCVGFEGLRALAGGLKALPRQHKWSVYVHPDCFVDGVLSSDEEAQELTSILNSMPNLHGWELVSAAELLDVSDDEEELEGMATTTIHGVRVTAIKE